MLKGLARTILTHGNSNGCVCKTNIVTDRRKLTPKRTEYGKEIRRAYESHEVSEKRANMSQLEPRSDGMCGTITTVSKDNLYLGKVENMGNYDFDGLEEYEVYQGEEYNGVPVEHQKYKMNLKKKHAMDNLEQWNKEYGVDREWASEDKWENFSNGRVDEYDTSPIREGKTLEDYLYTAENGEQYGIFKLTARECGRLQGVSDSDIDKMLAVNSRSQCYKQFGNSICVPVLMSIFLQLGIAGIPKWNDMTDDERYKTIYKGCGYIE